MKHNAMVKKWVPCFCILVLSVTSIKTAKDQDDGQYHPDDEGKYIPDDSGRYIPDYSGQYLDDGTGKYNGDDSGKYAHLDNKYRHQRDRQYPYNSLNSLNSFNSLNSLKTFNSKANFGAASSLKKQYVQPIANSNSVPVENVRYGKYDDNRWKIIRLASNVNDNGYHWEYETENEISGEENAKIHNSGTKDEALRTKGFYQYTGTDNKVYNVEYTADENGFIPKGTHLHPVLQKAILENLNRKDS